MKAFFCGWALAALLVQTARAEQRFQSGPLKTSLLELYTSEGCSSCPPAERELSGLRSAPALWKEFVPVAFHVTYWDNLGWPDRFARKEFTNRQYAYAEYWGSGNVYTPCFVRDGVEWHQHPAKTKTVSDAGVLVVTIDSQRKASVSYTPNEQTGKTFDVWFALTVSDVDSDVKRGENAGRNLRHDFLVDALGHQEMKTDLQAPATKTALAEFTVPASAGTEKGPPALAVWITPAGKLAPVLQATGGWLDGEPFHFKAF